MGRAAGDSPHYRFALVGGVGHIDLPSVTHIGHVLKDVLGFQAMAYWGFKLGVASQHPKVSVVPGGIDPLYEKAKKTDWSPIKQRDAAGERGTGSHDLSDAINRKLVRLDEDEDGIRATGKFSLNKQEVEWTEELLSGYLYTAARYAIDTEDAWECVFSEQTVWSLDHRFAGTLDLSRRSTTWLPTDQGIEIVDYKTHKPASSENDGPSYIDDRVQLSAYALAVEEMGLGVVRGTRVVLFGPDGNYEEDTRRVDPKVFLAMKEIHDEICRVCKERR